MKSHPQHQLNAYISSAAAPQRVPAAAWLQRHPSGCSCRRKVPAISATSPARPENSCRTQLAQTNKNRKMPQIGDDFPSANVNFVMFFSSSVEDDDVILLSRPTGNQTSMTIISCDGTAT